MILQHFLLAFFWVSYCIIHTILAASNIKLFFEKKSGKFFRYYRLSYSIFAAITLAILLYYQFSLESPQMINSFVIKYFAFFILVLPGLGIMIVTIFKYFRFLSGIRSLYSSAPISELKTDGIHRYVRHPLYTGTILFIWGLFFIFPLLNNFIAAFVITFYVLIGVKFEEKKLEREFGKSYKTYQSKVPKFIPHFGKKDK